MRFQITVLPGDGIGPEVCREAVRVLRALNAFYDCEFQFVERPIGGEAIRKTGSPLPPATLDACLNGDAAIEVQAIRAAIQCHSRIEIADFRLQRRDFRRGDVRRIAHNQIELQRL